MNKKSWVTVLLDGTVPLDKIKQLLDESYRNAR
jgi:predicted DNA-binding protein (MmcQ/YjbR family)